MLCELQRENAIERTQSSKLTFRTVCVALRNLRLLLGFLLAVLLATLCTVRTESLSLSGSSVVRFLLRLW